MNIASNVSRARARQLVAQGRLLFAGFALLAAVFGVLTRGQGVEALVVIAVWTAFGAVILWRANKPQGDALLIAATVVDAVVIGWIVLTTGGVISPFFPLLVLPPYSVSFLYGRRAMTLMVGIGLALYIASLAVSPRAVDPRITIMRFGAMLLIALGVFRRANYDDRVQEDLERLATWPHGWAHDREAIVRALLGRAAVALRVSRVALLWREADGVFFARLDGDDFDLEEDDAAPIVGEELAEASSFLDADQGLRNVHDSIEPFAGPFVAPDLRARLAASTILGARFASEAASGWLFALDMRRANADDVMLAEVVARLVSAGIEQFVLAQVIRDGAAANERLRLSRDLHDGLLQSLGGLALHAQAARRSAARDPRETERRLGVVVEQLGEAQRTLRDFVDELRPELTRRGEPLAERLRRLAESIAAQWNVPVAFSTEGDFDGADAGDIAAIVAEALTNAAKHAGATRIEASVRADGDGIRVDVVDDGRGFPFHGRYELPQLVAEERGPWSLKERVASLGGEMAIDSSSRGSRVEVRLPRAS